MHALGIQKVLIRVKSFAARDSEFPITRSSYLVPDSKNVF